MQQTVVIGAGISGLALAYELQCAGLDTVVLDSASTPGGVIKSENHGGFLVELGPNSTLTKPPVRCLIEKLALENELVLPQDHARKRFLAIKRSPAHPLELCAAPMSMREAALTPILSPLGKARLFFEPFAKAGQGVDESVDSFISRRVGREVTEMIVAPMLAGIWAADLERLSMRSALPLLWSFEKEHGSLLRGAISHFSKKRKESKPKKTRARLASFQTGMSALPQALRRALAPDSVQLNTEVLRIEETAGGICIHCRRPQPWPERLKPHSAPGSDGATTAILAERIVIAVQSPAAARLIEPLSSKLAAALRTIPYAPLGVLHLAYRQHDVQHPLDGFGFLIPPKFKQPLLGAVFSSSLFASRAPDGFHLLTVFSGGAAAPHYADINDERVREQIIRQLNFLIHAKASPQIIAQTYWPQSIPNYPLGHFHLQQAAREFEAQHPAISLLGAWDTGISVADRIDQASKLAASANWQTLNQSKRIARN